MPANEPTTKKSEEAGASISNAHGGLRSNEPTLARPMVPPEPPVPKSQETTVPEPSLVDVHISTSMEESEPARTEQLSLVTSDSFRDDPTRTSALRSQAAEQDAAAMMTPPPIQTLTPAPPPASVAGRGVKLVATSGLALVTLLTVFALAWLPSAAAISEEADVAAASAMELEPPAAEWMPSPSALEEPLPIHADAMDASPDAREEEAPQVIDASAHPPAVEPESPYPPESRKNPRPNRSRGSGKTKRDLPSSGL